MILRISYKGEWYADIPVKDIEDGLDIVNRMIKSNMEFGWRLHDELQGQVQGRQKARVSECGI